MLVGVIVTLAVAALIVQAFLMWSTKHGWFRHKNPEK